MTHPWIHYWRNSLADGDRMERNLVKLEHYTLGSLDVSEGYLPVAETARLIDRYEKKVNEKKGITDREDPEWEVVYQVELVIAPFSVLSAYEHTKRVGEMRKVYPFWFSALADRKGKLTAPEAKFPVFIRRALDPAAREDQVLSLGTVDRVDEVMAEGVPHSEEWKEYWQFVCLFFEKITGQAVEHLTLERLRVLTEYVVAIDEEIEGASDGIIKLYDHLARQARVPRLFGTLANPKSPALRPLISEAEWTGLLDDHLGQMSNRFALSFSQRQSLHHYARLQPGEMLAVNGPPGTGKTTLVHSVVAHHVVKAAVQGQEPFVMVVSSTNNQAITNVIDSLGQARSDQGMLAERWLPDVHSYALYLPASSTRPKPGTHYARPRGEGFPREVENRRYWERARAYYLKKASQWNGNDHSHVNDVVARLQERVKDLVATLEAGARAGAQRTRIRELLTAYRDGSNLPTAHDHPRYYCAARNEDEAQLRSVLDDYYEIREKESAGWAVLSSFRWARERRAIPYKKLFRTLPWASGLNYHDVNQLERFLLEKIDLLEQIRTTDEQWEAWKREQQLPDNPRALQEQLDKTLRHEAFLLATHYWEGRWLLEIEEALEQDSLRQNRESRMMSRYRRYAMLTPCLVATFYMMPKFFTYIGSNGASRFPEFPLLNFIDLLIVDEAGQVAPEVGAASFALAKQALVIGDVKQINPIWKIPKSIDRANLRKFGLWKILSSPEKIGNGFSAADGSLMRLAQHASHYQASDQAARGMLLTEHRRCFDEIIRYCNDLAYHGLLQPRRGSWADAPQQYVLPAVGYVRTEGYSRSTHGSRSNEDEARMIARWLATNQDRLMQAYPTPNGPARLEDVVGIVTPFTAQKYLIRQALRKVKINPRRMKIGTVHALQGAERAIVIFSMVYGANEPSRSFFFDQGENMLNVAVSRARDSFLLFGDVSVLDGAATSPSGKLIRHIRREGKAVGEVI